MLAQRLTTILPAMTLAEAIETTRIHSVAGLTGLTGDRPAVVTTRPFRAPHHTISDAGLIGGGHVPMPGEVSLAHNGILFLDELPEFRRHVLEVLRQRLEEGVVTITRMSVGIMLIPRPTFFSGRDGSRFRATYDLKRSFTCTPDKLLINRPYLVQAATHVIMLPNET
jgi:magnesium chelatase family protein